jgi:hypothetical protein
MQHVSCHRRMHRPAASTALSTGRPQTHTPTVTDTTPRTVRSPCQNRLPSPPSPLRPPFQRAPAPAFAWPSSESDSDSNLSSENTNVGRFWLPLFQEFTALRQRLMHCAPAGVSEKICVKLLQGAERRLNLNLSSVSAHEVCPFTEPAHCPSAMFCWRSDPHQEREDADSSCQTMGLRLRCPAGSPEGDCMQSSAH